MEINARFSFGELKRVQIMTSQREFVVTSGDAMEFSEEKLHILLVLLRNRVPIYSLMIYDLDSVP